MLKYMKFCFVFSFWNHINRSKKLETFWVNHYSDWKKIIFLVNFLKITRIQQTGFLKIKNFDVEKNLNLFDYKNNCERYIMPMYFWKTFFWFAYKNFSIKLIVYP